VNAANADRLRVHVVIDSMGAGGAELLLADFAAGAEAAGIELSVSYLARHDAEPARERLARLGIEPHWIEVERLVSPAAVGRVRDRLRAVAPDLVHTHLAYSDALGGVAARSLSLPTVSTIHVMHVDSGWRERVREQLIRRVRQRCAARTIFVSDAARHAFLERTRTSPQRAVTIHNGVVAEPRPGRGRAVRAALGIAPEDTVVGMLSVVRDGKGHDLAIAALRELRERAPGLRLLIAGDGPLRAALERSAAALGDAVVFAGYRDDAMDVLDSVDVLLHPSRFDAFPTALLEAMSASVPVVAGAVGGIPEIVVDGETGTLIDPTSAAGIAAGLAPLLADPALRARYAAAGRERFERRFTVADWATRMRSLYDEVVGARTRTAVRP
jgi:glycosyltransferase involved in cell wall biosynthesis